jgi:hypothetical protein
MLIIELDLARITASQGGYRERGTMKGAELARQVRSMRIALTALIDRFHRRQEQAAKRGDPVLEDGTQATLMDQVLNPAGANAWPRRAAAILHGLHLPVAPLLPAVPCRPQGADWLALDGDTYLTRLDDGPREARHLGSITALALYMAPLKTLRIPWIGAEADAAAAARDLADETANWTDWTGVSEPYALWLARECQRRSAGRS